MGALTVALRCLQHPLSLLSIAVLLVNDHVLKAAAPSLLTGKLSDFAGLFFFPFLLAFILALVADPLRVPPRRTAALAFAITAAWFTLIKTSVWANAVTVAALASVLGPTVQIVLDPTDLVALAVLWPAWRLWRQTERAAVVQSRRLAAVVTLAVAAFATMATSAPTPAYFRIINTTAIGSAVYLLGESNSRFWYLRSDDVGQSWRELTSLQLPAPVRQQFEPQSAKTAMVCLPKSPTECYSVSGQHQIQTSYDAGSSWSTAWKVPEIRREFMRRAAGGEPNSFISSRGYPIIDRSLYAISLVDRQDGPYLVVANGTEGVLVRIPNGTWERRAVGTDAQPTPFAVHHPLNALSILKGELTLGIIVAWLAFMFLSTPAWNLTRAAFRPELNGCLAGFLVMVSGLGGMVAMMANSMNGSLSDPIFNLSTIVLVLFVFAPVIPGFLLVFPFLMWNSLFNSVSSVVPWKRVMLGASAGSVMTLLTVLLPFFWWAYGIIPDYETAVRSALVGGVLAFAVALAIVWDTTRAAAFGQQPPEVASGGGGSVP